MNLDTPLVELDFVPHLRARQLARFGLVTVGDLLLHFPRRYEDRREFDKFPTDATEGAVCVCGEVTRSQLKRFGGSQKMFDVMIEDSNPTAFAGRLVLRWFNSHWVEKMFANGMRVVVYGKPKRSGSNMVITHPDFEIVENDAEESIHLKRIAPIHGATEGLTPRLIRWIIWTVLERLTDESVPTLLPPKLDPCSRIWALRQMHFPESYESLEKARRHCVLEEFLRMQLSVAASRNEQQHEQGAAHCGNGELMRRLHAALPFPLTGAQQRAIAEVQHDLALTRPMNRLLHGDVGAGKTLVAMSAMLLCVEAGYQAALMAPTQILAEQHYLNFKRLLDPLGIRVALRTGSRREGNSPLPLFEKNAKKTKGSTRAPRVVSGDPPETLSQREPSRGEPSTVAYGEGSPDGETLPASRREQHAGRVCYPSQDEPGTSSRGEPSFTYAKRALPHFQTPTAAYTISFATVGRRPLSPEARDIVLDTILHWSKSRYDLFAACVMPDHVHLILKPWIKEHAADGSPQYFPLTQILHSIKSFTAHEINKLTGASGAVWEKESFDRYIRSSSDLEEKFLYVVHNPVSEKLVENPADYRWAWWPGISSATESPNAPSAKGSTRAPRVVSGDPPETLSQREPSRGEPSTVAYGEGSPDGETLPASRREQHAGRVCYPSQDEPQIFIGTHALLYEGAGFTNLGLAVIDEQHKFGVVQRAKLRAQAGEIAPDVLVMTATPIPRTLTMTLYGDLDVSILDELPPGRGKIITGIRPPTKLPDAAKFIRSELESGRQCYIVYPLVEESEKLEAKAATAEFEKWKKLLAPMQCALIHGRIPPEEKEQIMTRFRSGEAKALIATTVIEVGVDVPNATVMLIENAERFGLAQLHQLRGRIGRGGHKSYCVLITSADDPESIAKLQVLVETTDGFRVAEEDLRQRGWGNLLGTEQAGKSGFRLGDPIAQLDLMQLARNHAFLIFEHDPTLSRPEHAGARQLLAAARKATFAQVS